MENRKNTEYISLLSVISAFSVVSLHTNGCFWEFSTARYWLTANIIESVYYFAVPIFFMISGATLIDYPKRYDGWTYAKKRVHRTVIPFLTWSLIGWAIPLLHLLYRGRPVAPELLSVSGIWNGIVGTSFVPIYWFFIPLFLCYMSIPLFASVPDEKKIRMFSYLAGAAFLLNSLVPFLLSVFHLSLKWPFHLEAAGGYLMYVLLGYVLSRISLSRKHRLILYALALGGLLLHILGTYALSMNAGKIIQTYKGYLNVPCILYSIGIFIFFKENSVKMMRKSGGVIRFLKNYTFAIYLLHFLIMQGLLKAFHWDAHSIIYRLLAPVLIGSICIGITYMIRKLPIVKNILP